MYEFLFVASKIGWRSISIRDPPIAFSLAWPFLL